MPIRRPTLDDVMIFPSAADFRTWLEANHATATELWVGYYKKAVPKVSVSYPQAVEQALCFGWIDGITYRIDEEVTASRFTPRRRGSNWSAVNIARAEELIADRRMTPAGRAAFGARDRTRDARYAYENRPEGISEAAEARLRAHPAAWRFWLAQTPSYRRTVTWWLLDAKRQETRDRRLETLVDDCAHERRIKPIA